MSKLRVASFVGVMACVLLFEGCAQNQVRKLEPVKPVVVGTKLSIDPDTDSQQAISEIKYHLRDRTKEYGNVQLLFQRIYFNRFAELRSILNSRQAHVTDINLTRNFIDPATGLFDFSRFNSFKAMLWDQKKSLKELILTGNDMGDQSTLLIASYIESANNQLNVLDLRYNLISNRGLIALIDSLKSKNSQITTLLVDGNTFDPQARQWAIKTVNLINQSKTKPICLDLEKNCQIS